MDSDPNQILTQLCATILGQQRMICELARNDLLLIESVRSSISGEHIAVAAQTVRATLYSVDELSDRIRQLEQQVRHR